MSGTEWEVGSRAITDVTFRDDTGALADPTTITYWYKTPAGVSTSIVYPAAGISRTSVGLYHAVTVITAPGTWWFGMTGAGAVIDAVKTGIVVPAWPFS